MDAISDARANLADSPERGVATPAAPEKLSELMTLALDDLAYVEAHPERFTVEMSQWYFKPDGSTCHVCLAGAVMTRRLLGADAREGMLGGDYDPSDCGQSWYLPLQALDHIRTGEIGLALHAMRKTEYPYAAPVSTSASIPRFWQDMTRYDDDRAGWRKDMVEIRDLLQREGF